MASSLARAASYGSLNRVASHGSLSRAAASPAVNSPPAASPARASPAAPRRAPARVAATPADGADIAVAGPAPASPAPRSKVSAGAAAVLAPPAPASFQPHPLVPPPVHPELLAALSPAPPQLPPVAARELPIPAVERARFGDVYAAGDLLGRGTFGDVRSATEVATGRRVAVKELPKRIGGRDKREVIMQEVAFCQLLQGCPITARLHGVYEDSTHVYIAQELCSGGDIDSLQAAAGGRLDEREAAAVVLSVLRFLAHAHAAGVCYGDVKPGNFVLRRLYPCIDHMIDPSAPKGPLDVCAVDFGCCQHAEPDVCLPDMPISGTPAYLSPEAFSQCFGMPADVWAAGVMLYHLLSGSFPFWVGSGDQLHGMTEAELRDGIVRGSPMFMRDPWAGYSPRVKDLICKMLEKNPEERISAAAAASHVWFAEVLGDGAAPGAASAAVQSSR